MLKVTGIRYYPIKSCGGIDIDTASVESRGIAHDRRFMLVDANNRFVTQRQHPKMVNISVQNVGDEFVVSAPGCPNLLLPKQPEYRELARVKIWRSLVKASVADARTNAWFSGYMKIPVRLAYMNDDQHRAVPNESAEFDDEVSFADGSPLLLTSEGSLNELNSRLDSAIMMNRFRPNIIVNAAAAFVEDSWTRIRIEGVEFSVAWKCARCTMITIDPKTAVPDPDGEPLETLKTFRRVGRGVMFGQNLLPRVYGEIHVGAEVEILE